jgi:signal transduction histidine kinase
MSAFLPLFAVAVAAAFAAPICAAETLPPSVLLLDQSGPGLRAYIEIADNFRSTLRTRSELHVSIYHEHLDLTRFSSPAHLAAHDVYLRAKYRDIPIGIIVAIGAKALEYAVPLRTEAWSNTPIVFVAVAEAVVARSTLAPNVTGQTLRVSLGNFITAAQSLVPNLKRVALIGDPLEQQVFRSHFKSELPAIAATLELLDLTGQPLSAVKRQTAALPDDAAILYTALNLTGDQRLLWPIEALSQVAQSANRPIVIDVETFLGHGATGGFVVVPAPIGREAALLVSRIFAGEQASRIPVTVADAVKPVFDWRQLQRWGVSETQLPSDSEIRFRQSTLWEQHRWRIILIAAAFLLQTALVIGLLYEDRRRRIAEANGHMLWSELVHLNRVSTAGQVTASIAHEIRQPLAAIVASASAALNWLKNQKPNLDEAGISLRDVISEGHRANTVISNIRAIFTNDTAPHVTLNVNELIEQVLPLTTRKFAIGKVALRATLPDNPPPVVVGDKVQLQQVLLNLILNALEAMAMSQGPHALRLTTGIKHGDVMVTIEDTGPGIDPNAADKIFTPFFTTKSGGMGMGLSICKSIIEAHHGHLTATSNGHGAIFQIVLPVHSRVQS